MTASIDPSAMSRRSRSDAPGTRRRQVNPPTKRALLSQLKVGDVVMQRADYPVVIVHIGPAHNVQILGRAGKASRWIMAHSLYGRYIWADPNDPSWILGDFEADRAFLRAI